MSIQKSSELFTITGRTHRDNEPGQPPPASYSITENCPVSYAVSSPWHLRDRSELGTIKVSSSAQSLEVEVQDNSCDTFTFAEATAETIFNFKPKNNTITLDFTGYVDMHYFENEVEYKLENIGGGGSLVLVDSKKWTTEGTEAQGSSARFNFQEQAVYRNLDPASDYRIRLYGKVSCGDNPGAGAKLKIVFEN